MEPYGITTFCDDIRFEQLGKISLIGCYGPELLLFANFPATIPRLCFFVQLRLPPGKVLPMKILIYFPGDEATSPTFSQNLPLPTEEGAVGKLQEFPSDEDVKRQLSIDFPILLSSVLLKGEGHIKVRAAHGDRVIRAGTLKITQKLGTPGKACDPVMP